MKEKEVLEDKAKGGEEERKEGAAGEEKKQEISWRRG